MRAHQRGEVGGGIRHGGAGMSASDMPPNAPLFESSHFAHEYATHKVTEVVLLLVNWLSKHEGDAPLTRARELLAEARRARGAADQLLQLHEAARTNEPGARHVLSAAEKLSLLHEAARAEGSLGYPGGPCGPQPAAQPEHTAPHKRAAMVKAELAVRGLSLSKIAAELEVGRAAVSLVLRGERRSARIEHRLASAIGLDPAVLWRRGVEP